MVNEFAGELAYKDRHGRVWRFTQKRTMWIAETLDIGHTVHSNMADYNLIQLLNRIDREEFTTDDRSAQPLETGEGGSGIAGTGPKSQPESIEEIRRNASEIDGNEPPYEYPLQRFDERDE